MLTPPKTDTSTPIERMCNFSILSPVLGVAFSSLMLGETLTSTILIALALNAVGIVLVNRPGR